MSLYQNCKKKKNIFIMSDPDPVLFEVGNGSKSAMFDAN